MNEGTSPDANDHDVDLPIFVSRSVAEEVLEGLDEDGRVTLELTESEAPEIAEQIEWQLENEQPMVELVEEYHGTR